MGAQALRRAEHRARGGPTRRLREPAEPHGGTLKAARRARVARRGLSYFAYATPDPASLGVATQWETLGALKAFGSASTRTRARRSAWTRSRRRSRTGIAPAANSANDTDGLVIKVDALRQQQRLGATSKSPRWRSPSSSRRSPRSRGCSTSSSRSGATGAVTPVAILEPVLLLGTTVARATLHNLDEIRRKDIRVGDQVVVEKGRRVIPKIVRALTERRTARSAS